MSAWAERTEKTRAGGSLLLFAIMRYYGTGKKAKQGRGRCCCCHLGCSNQVIDIAQLQNNSSSAEQRPFAIIIIIARYKGLVAAPAAAANNSKPLGGGGTGFVPHLIHQNNEEQKEKRNNTPLHTGVGDGEETL